MSTLHDCVEYPSHGSNIGWVSLGAITVDLAEGRAFRFGEESLLYSIEGAYGSFEGDHLFGDDGPNKFFGEAGRDEIFGRGGDDYLDGGNEVDTLNGGLGIDECVNGEAVTMCE